MTGCYGSVVIVGRVTEKESSAKRAQFVRQSVSTVTQSWHAPRFGRFCESFRNTAAEEPI
jgi:hypothetical protein